MQFPRLSRAVVSVAVGGIVALVAMCGALNPVTAATQDHYFDANGVRLHYVEQGSGEPIVLLHGFGGSAQATIETGVFANLSKDYRVIAMDLRGHGKSDKPRDAKLYGREMALDVVRLLDHLKIQRAHIEGYSMGGQIVGQLLTLHPERIITVTLGGAPVGIRWTDDDEQRIQLEAAEMERDGVSSSQIIRLAPPDAKPSDREIAKRSQAALANPGDDRFALSAVHRTARDRIVTTEAIIAATVPMLGIVGSLDAFYMPKFQELKTLKPAMTLVVIDGATHGSPGDPTGARRRPEYVAAIREFIAANRRTAATSH
jgi:pimeloyl-ACP methyl ester carboxylesterase